VPPEYEALLYDPQTSGGLLAAIAPESVDSAMAAFERHGVQARMIGEVIAKRSPLIDVV
jgi:selenide,water dikinase